MAKGQLRCVLCAECEERFLYVESTSSALPPQAPRTCRACLMFLRAKRYDERAERLRAQGASAMTAQRRSVARFLKKQADR